MGRILPRNLARADGGNNSVVQENGPEAMAYVGWRPLGIRRSGLSGDFRTLPMLPSGVGPPSMSQERQTGGTMKHDAGFEVLTGNNVDTQFFKAGSII